MRRPHIRTQTGLRGIAALTVIPAHLGLNKIFPDQWPFINELFPSGPAVNVFFALSGFILCYSYYDDSDPDYITVSSWVNFFVARIARILPLYYILTIVGYLLFLFLSLRDTGQDPLKDILTTVTQLLFIHPFPGITVPGWIGPSWSLAMEAFAYAIIFPLLTVLKLPQVKRLSLLCILTGCLVLFNILANHYCSTIGLNEGFQSWPALIRIFTFFPLGMIFYQFGKHHKEFAKYLASKSSFGFSLALAWHMTDKLMFPDMPLHSSWGQIIAILFILQDSTSTASRFLSSQRTVWLGTISYSIYLVHVCFGLPVIAYADHIANWSPIGRISLVLAQTAIILTISPLLYTFVEMKGKKLITSGFKALRTRASAALRIGIS